MDSLYDLGFAVARLETSESGEPILTLLSPATDDLGPQQIIIGPEGTDALIQIAHRLRYWQSPPTLAQAVAINPEA